MKRYRAHVLLDDGDEIEFVLNMSDDDALWDSACELECWERGLKFASIDTVECLENEE